MSGHVVVDYEELRRLERVWQDAAKSVAVQAVSVGLLTTDCDLLANAVFDPIGASRAAASIAAAATIPHGLAALSAKFGADALALEAVVVKEQLVDDFPIHELAAFEAWLATAPFRLPFNPRGVWHEGNAMVAALAGAGVAYLSPFLEPILSVFAPSTQFRFDAATGRPLRVDPVFGVPLASIGLLEPEGVGNVATSPLRPIWADQPIGSMGGVLRRVSDLERMPFANFAVERVAGADGRVRWVVELPGIRSLGATADPQDLVGAISAVALPATAYTRCVVDALDAAGVPRGASVMLVGHSEGGIVAMDLAGDPSFNGSRVRVTHVVAAGSPISSKPVVAGSGTVVLSVENVNDVVTHLDALDAAPQTPQRLTYQFSAPAGEVAGAHDAGRYADRLDDLVDSPNPLWHDFTAQIAPYLRSPTSTLVFSASDQAPN